MTIPTLLFNQLQKIKIVAGTKTHEPTPLNFRRPRERRDAKGQRRDATHQRAASEAATNETAVRGLYARRRRPSTMPIFVTS